MELSNEFNLKEIEQATKNYLSKVDLKKLIDDSSDKMDKIMFIEGPPTLNGEPHAGHLRGRVFKDLWYRFNTLNRSEEHTSELQSLVNLVCRLLLEKKKRQPNSQL